MQTWVCPETAQCLRPPLLVISIPESADYAVEVQLQLLRYDMLDQRLDGNVVIAVDGSEVRIGARALGQQVLMPGIGRGGVLRDGWLNAFEREPVCCKRSAQGHASSARCRHSPVKAISRGTLGSGAFMSFSKSTSSSST